MTSEAAPDPSQASSPDLPPPLTANPEGWEANQIYELNFWKNEWPFRDRPLAELQKIRHADAAWFLREMNFPRGTEHQFEGFAGSVLEVGSGPMGFFELMEGVEVIAQDSLMALYAQHLSFSLLGQRGSTCYIAEPVSAIHQQFDFVVCSNVLDHTADWIEFLEQCCQRVRPGGELLLFTECRGAPCPGHTQVFTPPQLFRLVSLLGAKPTPVCRSRRSKRVLCDFGCFVRAKF